MAFLHSLCMCALNISECYIHPQLKETDNFTSNHNRKATDRPDNYNYSIIIRCRRICASIVMRSSMTLTIQGRHRPRYHGDHRDRALLFLCAASIDAEFQAVCFKFHLARCINRCIMIPCDMTSQNNIILCRHKICIGDDLKANRRTCKGDFFNSCSSISEPNRDLRFLSTVGSFVA